MSNSKRHISSKIITTYDQFAGKYTQMFFDDQSDLPYLNKMFLSKLKKDSSVLDVGCGPGTFAQHLTKTGLKVHGVDLSPAMIDIAKCKVPSAQFSIMNMTNLDFSDQSFEAILSAYSLIHIPTPKIHKTLLEWRRVLKPGGLLFIICQKGKANQVFIDSELSNTPMFFNFFTTSRLSNFLKKAGFVIVDQQLQTIENVTTTANNFIYTLAQRKEWYTKQC